MNSGAGKCSRLGMASAKRSAPPCVLQISRCPAFAAFALVFSAASYLTCAQAAQQLAQAPLPPRRPAHLDNRETAPAAPALQQPAPVPSPAPATRAPAKPAPAGLPADAPYHPMTEPGPMTQRRTAIRACTEEWQKLKTTGAAGTRIWREFSMECLLRKK